MKIISGGVCAAKGFLAAGVHCGIRRSKAKKDLCLIVSQTRAVAASVYTQNLVKGAPILVTQENLADGYAQAILCNSGNANTCNENGVEMAGRMCALVEEHTGISRTDVIVASTGVIGQKLDIAPIESGMPALKAALGPKSADAAEAIMTTDTLKKEIAVETVISGACVAVGGIAKGSGMIHPNMATMLAFITTDADITGEMLDLALREVCADTFNMVSVDADTSTNDMASIVANGLAGNARIDRQGADFDCFKEALCEVMAYLARTIAKDGEGATKLIECEVAGAADKGTARMVAKSVICSNLLKAAMFGADANWGRVLCAIGYSGAQVDIAKVDVSFRSKAGEILVCRGGFGVDFSEEKAKKILCEKEVVIAVDLNAGGAGAIAYGCDLTYDYVKINGDYRS